MLRLLLLVLIVAVVYTAAITYKCPDYYPDAVLFEESGWVNPDEEETHLAVCNVLVQVPLNYSWGLGYCYYGYGYSHITNVFSQSHLDFLVDLLKEKGEADAWVGATSLVSMAETHQPGPDWWKIPYGIHVATYGKYWPADSAIGKFPGYGDMCGYLEIDENPDNINIMHADNCLGSTVRKAFFCYLNAIIDDTVNPTSGGGSGDPHILLNVHGTEDKICFDFLGEDGDVVQLLHDVKKGVTVNAKLMHLDLPSGHKSRQTFFDTAAVILGEDRITVGLNDITINDETIIDWLDKEVTVPVGRATVSIHKNMAKIEVDSDVVIEIQYHKWSTTTRHLGIFFTNETGLSPAAHGLLGQFSGKEITATGDVTDKKSLGKLTLASNGIDQAPGERVSVIVTAESRHNFLDGGKKNCWFVEGEAEQLVDGTIKDYYVSDLHYNRLATNLVKYLKI